MTKRRQTLGRDGERQAARYLEARGYRIVARNVRAARVEMDLIARRGPLLVFVEVKSRRKTGPSAFGHHGAAAESVDARKQARLRRGASAWLDENPGERRGAKRLRFDVITCLLSDGRPDPISSTKPNTVSDAVSDTPSAATSRRAPRPPPPDASQNRPNRAGSRNDDTAPPEGARWSIEHWQAAF